MHTKILSTDADAQQIVISFLDKAVGTFERELLQAVLSMFDIASFVENQTYLRPTHTDPSKQKSPAFTMVCIIISLRTTLENERITTQYFWDTFASPDDVLVAPAADIALVIHRCGMAATKAATIHRSLRFLYQICRWDWQKLMQIPIETLREQLLSVQGLGPKAVDCFLLLGLDLPVFPVDTNVFQYVTRHYPRVLGAQKPSFSSPRHVALVKQFLEQTLPPDAQLYQVAHTMLLLANKYGRNPSHAHTVIAAS
jgi:endonuclease III